MATRKRKGMIVKNTNLRPVTVEMATRTITVRPGDEVPLTAEEVRDAALREQLQVRAISIVRPSTDEEEQALQEHLESLEDKGHAEVEPDATD